GRGPGNCAGLYEEVARGIAGTIEARAVNGVDLRGDVVRHLVELVRIARQDRVADLQEAADLTFVELAGNVDAADRQSSHCRWRRRRHVETERIGFHDQWIAWSDRDRDRASIRLGHADAGEFGQA